MLSYSDNTYLRVTSLNKDGEYPESRSLRSMQLAIAE
jgi:hypothetical protein